MFKTKSTKFWLAAGLLAFVTLSWHAETIDREIEIATDFSVTIPVYEDEVIDLQIENSVSLLQSSLPCNWEWWMYNNRDCVPQSTWNDGVASSDAECRRNCSNGTIKSYQSVCVSYAVDEDSQTLTPTVWFRHGCTNCPQGNDINSLAMSDSAWSINNSFLVTDLIYGISNRLLKPYATNQTNTMRAVNAVVPHMFLRVDTDESTANLIYKPVKQPRENVRLTTTGNLDVEVLDLSVIRSTRKEKLVNSEQTAIPLTLLQRNTI